MSEVSTLSKVIWTGFLLRPLNSLFQVLMEEVDIESLIGTLVGIAIIMPCVGTVKSSLERLKNIFFRCHGYLWYVYLRRCLYRCSLT